MQACTTARTTQECTAVAFKTASEAKAAGQEVGQSSHVGGSFVQIHCMCIIASRMGGRFDAQAAAAMRVEALLLTAHAAPAQERSQAAELSSQAAKLSSQGGRAQGRARAHRRPGGGGPGEGARARGARGLRRSHPSALVARALANVLGETDEVTFHNWCLSTPPCRMHLLTNPFFASLLAPIWKAARPTCLGQEPVPCQ